MKSSETGIPSRALVVTYCTLCHANYADMFDLTAFDKDFALIECSNDTCDVCFDRLNADDAEADRIF